MNNIFAIAFNDEGIHCDLGCFSSYAKAKALAEDLNFIQLKALNPDEYSGYLLVVAEEMAISDKPHEGMYRVVELMEA